MSAVFVEVVDVGPSEPHSVALVENDNVIEELTAAVANPPLGYGILPGTAIGGSARFRGHRLDERDHVPAEDRVAVEDQMSRRGIEQYKTRNEAVGTVKKSIAAMPFLWLRRNASQRRTTSGFAGRCGM
jgi:hypothetical protein